MLMTLLSMLGGGVLRLAPELFGLLNKGKDYAHELAMMDKQAELAKSKAADDRETMRLAGDINQTVALLDAQKMALQAQSQLSGIKWADALNILVRPLTTYYYLAMFGAVKLATVAIALKSADPWHAILLSWDADDRAVLSGILAFWFVGRVFDKQK